MNILIHKSAFILTFTLVCTSLVILKTNHMETSDIFWPVMHSEIVFLYMKS